MTDLTGVCNVKVDFGAVGNGTTDDRAAIQAALDSSSCRILYFPPGTYLINSSLLLSSNNILTGAGRTVTTIKLNAATAGANDEVIRTSNFTGSAHSTLVSNIGIENMTLDGDCWNPARANPAPGTASTIRGSTLLLSTVENAFVRNCRIMNGNKHCLDIAASTYQTSGALTRATGPSRNVVVENCEGVDPYFDDCFTVHDSGDLVIRDCRLRMNTSRQPLRNDFQNGVEVDDGSYRVMVENCYARGFARGFQVKGHEFNYPARDVTLSRCTAYECNVGFQIWYPLHTMRETNPSVANHAQSIFIRDCTVALSTTVLGYDKGMFALSIGGYQNVSVDGFSVEGGTYSARAIYVYELADNVSFENILFKNITVPSPPIMNGLIHFFTEATGVYSVRNVAYTRQGSGTTSLPIPVVWVTPSVAEISIRQITAALASGVAGVSVYYLRNSDLNELKFTGNSTPVNIRGGSPSGNLSVRAAVNNKFSS